MSTLAEDVERGDTKSVYGEKLYSASSPGDAGVEEHETLLPSTTKEGEAGSPLSVKSGCQTPRRSTSAPKLLLAFAAGVGTCFAMQFAFPSLCLTASSPLASIKLGADLGRPGSQVVSFKPLGAYPILRSRSAL